MKHSNGYPSGTWTGTRITRNGGGFVTQIGFAADGTAAIGCDIHSCYFKRPTDIEWQPIMTVSQMPAGDVSTSLVVDGNYTDTSGCFAIGIAPNDATRIYFTYNGYLYRFSTATLTATRCGFTREVLIAGTGEQRTYSTKLAVDDQNKSAFLFGTLLGVYYSTNDGTTVTSLAAPACDTDSDNNAGGGPYKFPHLVAIDPTSSVSGGLRQRCYYSVRAAGATGGVYESTTGPGGTYTLIAGSPKDIRFMRFGASGKLWVGTAAGDMWWYTKAAGVFTKLAANPTSGATTLAEDPANAAHLVVIDGASNMAQSFDTGATWQNWAAASTQISMATTQAYLQPPYGVSWGGTTQGVIFNPAGSNELWRVWGYGISKTTLPATLGGAPTRWYEMNLGIDEGCCTELTYAPGVGLFAGFLDLGTWKLSDFSRANNRPKTPQKATDTWDLKPPFINQPTDAIGYAADNPNYVVTLTRNGYWGLQPYTVGTTASPTLTIGNAFSITVNGTTTTVTLTGTTLASAITDIMTAAPYGITASNDGANHLQLVSSANYPFTLANVTGTPLTTLGLGTGPFTGTAGSPKANPHSGTSSDGGNAWTMFATTPFDDPSYGGSSFGGAMAVGPQGIILIAWPASRSFIRTKDGGVTWGRVPFPGIPASGTENGIGDWSPGYFSKKNICYDAAGSAFYLYDYGPPTDTAKAGIWKSTDNGDTWTQVYAGSFTDAVYNCRLRPVPGKAGHLFLTAGPGASTAPALYRSINGGVTWTAVSGTAAIHDVAFSGFGGAYPAVLVFGTVGGVGGYHISYDNCVSWTHLGYPGDWADYPKVLCGNTDKLEFYAGLNGSGVMRIAYSYPINLAA